MGNALLHPTITKVPGRDAFNLFRLRSAILAPQPERVIRSHPPLHREWWNMVHGSFCLAGGADWASRQLPVARPQGPA